MAPSDPSRAVLITGCSSGIGRATALGLARAGWPVWASARRPESIADLAEAGCRTLALDVTESASIAAAVSAVEREHGAVGVLVDNAGYSQSGVFEEVPMAAVRRQFETNVLGLVDLTQRVLPAMRRQGWGRVVIVGSMAGRLTFPGAGFYHATKHALEALADALRFEVSGFGIGVTLIQPGFIRTRFAATAVGSMDGPPEGQGPYADLSARVADLTRAAYEDPPLSWLATGPEAVARTIERAVTARRAPTRRKVAASAHLTVPLRGLLGDRLWDLVLGTIYPRPRARTER